MERFLIRAFLSFARNVDRSKGSYSNWALSRSCRFDSTMGFVQGLRKGELLVRNEA